MFLAETELITGGVSMYPTLETIRQLAQTKEYRRIPLCRELYADRYTPVEVMRILRKASRHCYLLESASQTEVWGRYSFLGYEPSMEIIQRPDLLLFEHDGPAVQFQQRRMGGARRQGSRLEIGRAHV